MEAFVILAGGAGTRLWPASTQEHPKQLLTLGSSRTFLQATVERALEVNFNAEVVVVTHSDHAEVTAAQLADYAERGARITVLPEPVARNTAPAAAFAAAFLKTRLTGEARMMILPADHLIRPTERFKEDVFKADLFGARGFITVFGIPPTEANTGYGYIEEGTAMPPGAAVKAFKEKPDGKTAEAYVKAGRYYWNSGMFLVSLKTITEEFEKLAPSISRPFAALKKDTLDMIEGETERRKRVLLWGRGETVERLYADLPSVSLDYAVMEKSTKVAMIKAGFEWFDVGSWDEVARLLPSECPKVVTQNAEGNAVYSDLPVVLCGVEDLIVVIRDGKALVAKKGSSQFVREAVLNYMKTEDRTR